MDLLEDNKVCIKIDFEPNSENPQRVFDSMSHLISSIESFHACLLSSVSAEASSKILLSNIKEGSIESWLSHDIEDNKGEKHSNKLISFLNACTNIVIEFIEGKETINSLDDLSELDNEIESFANEYDVIRFPNVYSLDKYKMLKGYVELGKATEKLNHVDQAYLNTENNEQKINKNFYLSDEKLREVIIDNVDSSEANETLIIKKADFIGQSMWDFVRNKVSIPVKIRDENWLAKFQSREEVVSPGDALYCTLKTKNYFDKPGKLIETKYEITKVIRSVDFIKNQMEIEYDGE